MSTATSDRLLVLQEFDASRTGVKGLVDSGITSLPSFFVHPNPPSPNPNPNPRRRSIPIIDFSLPRSSTVHLLSAAAKSPGFFHVTNHSIPPRLLADAISAVRSFNELPSSVRSSHYSRKFTGGVSYASNFDLFRSPAASWRDTIQINLAPTPPDPAQIPEIYREEILSLEKQFTIVAKEVMGLLMEGLGVEKGRLEEMLCCDRKMMVCH